MKKIIEEIIDFFEEYGKTVFIISDILVIFLFKYVLLTELPSELTASQLDNATSVFWFAWMTIIYCALDVVKFLVVSLLKKFYYKD